MIHAPDNIDSIVARLTSRLEFFNSLGYKQTWTAKLNRARFLR